uniref:Uncharacterized protein n=1 Tax=Arundo donax TaxID=35708 RepID=A0A0A9H8J0_ARUDO
MMFSYLTIIIDHICVALQTIDIIAREENAVCFSPKKIVMCSVQWLMCSPFLSIVCVPAALPWRHQLSSSPTITRG